MAAAPVRFGIVGTGMIADFHARAIAGSGAGQLTAVAGRNAEKVAAFAQKFAVPFSTTEVAALVARTDVDVVCITTPSGAHLEPALAAIRSGKHVLIEKPLEITPERVDLILAAAEKAGVRVASIFQARFGAGARAVKAALEAGRLGRLALASVQVKWHRPASYYTGWKGTLALDGGAVLMNQAIHGLDLLQWFAGLPEEVFAWTTRRVHTGIEGEDTACATVRFPGGALGTIEATTAMWPGWSRRIELCGEHGSICLEDDRIVRWDFPRPEPGDAAIKTPQADDALDYGASSPGAITLDGHVRQYQDLCAALRENRPLALDGREGRKAVALVHALYQSAERGVPVKL
jgi:predicted dehydrogenase